MLGLKKYDTNEDCLISRSEAQNRISIDFGSYTEEPGKTVYENFFKSDANKDNQISLDEAGQALGVGGDI